MSIRWIKKKSGEIALQQYEQVGQNNWGHVVFGWVDVETVDEYELPIEEQSHPGDHP